jgi:signal transduction histidine kinase
MTLSFVDDEIDATAGVPARLRPPGRFASSVRMNRIRPAGDVSGEKPRYRLGVALRIPRALSLGFDIAVVVAVAAITEANVWRFHSVAGPKWLTAALPLLWALPLAFRRSRPLPATVLVIGGIVLQALASGNSAEGLELIIAIAVTAYSVAAYSDRRGALVGLATLVAGYGIYALEDHNIRSGRTSELWAGAFFGVGILAAWLIGIFVHSGRERSALQALAAEHERSAAVAAAEERARLARELHDIVSHNLSVVVLQAGGARAQGEDASASALEKIELSSREALVEMRRLLGVLRRDDDGASLSPQPGIAQIEALAAGVRAAGLHVEVTLDGALGELPPALELSVYRIVQEALTNALKHGRASRAVIEVRRTGDVVTVDVVDDGAAAPETAAGTAGHGLIGMRERVALFGGELRTGRRPDGGYAVSATLPLTT